MKERKIRTVHFLNDAAPARSRHIILFLFQTPPLRFISPFLPLPRFSSRLSFSLPHSSPDPFSPSASFLLPMRLISLYPRFLLSFFFQSF